MDNKGVVLIASDWRGAMIRPGGVAEYVDTLERGLRSLGTSVKVLAAVQPDEIEFIAPNEACYRCLIPLQIERDAKPANWLGRKCVSFLEILRCLSPRCRAVVEHLDLFAASTDSIARFEGVLAKEKPAAVVFVHLNVNLYPLALSLIERQQPYGIIAHDSEICQLRNNKMNDLVIRRSMLKGASWIAANSHHTKLLLEKWKLSADQVKVVHCPVSEDLIRESAAREPTSGKDDDLNLVTICRLVRGKGIDIVIRALKTLAERGIPFRYEVGGDGPERRSLEELVDEMGLRDKIHFQGGVQGESKWRLLRQGNVFVMPSRCEPTIPWQEGFGIAFVEAAAFGVPAVGSRSGGIPDAVVDGETGILVPEESPGDLADALIFLYQNPEARRRMGAAARERARSQFSPEVIAAQFRELINVSARKRSHSSGPKRPQM